MFQTKANGVRSAGYIWKPLFFIRHSEVLVQSHERHEFLYVCILELSAIGVGVIHNILCLCRVIVVIGDAFFDIAEIRLNLNVMLIGLQCSLHEPTFDGHPGGHGNGITIHDPLEVACHIIALQAHDVAVMQVVIDDGFVALPLCLGIRGVVRSVFEIEERMAIEGLKEMGTLWFASDGTPKEHLRFFRLQGHRVTEEHEMSHLVHVQECCIGCLRLPDRTAFGNGGCIKCVSHVARRKHPSQILREITKPFVGVEEINAWAALVPIGVVANGSRLLR